jgi:O-antigen/teichoic acid export membrane protein
MNITALTCIQGSNALAPLVVFPYALHTLGSVPYAELILSEAVSLLVLAIVVFSFDVLGISSVVQLATRGDRGGLSELFSSILYVRLSLFFSATFAAVTFYHFAMGGPFTTIMLWTMVPLAYIFQSTWLFQGLERNMPPAVFALVSRVACVGLILALVRVPNDKNLVPAIMGLTYLLGGLASFAYAAYRHELRLQKVRWGKLSKLVVDGKEVFLGNISVSLSKDMNVLILGLIGVPAHSLAAYSVAEKLTKSFQAFARPLNQLFFPKAIRAIENERAPTWPIAKKLLRLTLPQLATLTFILVVLAIGYLVAGKYTTIIASFPNIAEITSFLSVMISGVFFGIVSFMLGSVGLNYLNCRAYVFKVILAVGLLSASTCFVLAHWIGAFAGVYCYAAAELLTALLIVQRFGFQCRFPAIFGGPRKI